MNVPLAQIVQWLLVYKYFIFFPITVIEGPIATVIAGFLVSTGKLEFLIVYLVALAGDLVGDVMYYGIGKLGKKRFARKGTLLGINRERMHALESHFDNHNGKTLIIGKLTHAIGAPILVAAGVAETPMASFLWFNFLGTMPKILFFELIGYYFGKSYELIGRSIDLISGVAFVLAILAIAVAYYYHRRKKKNGRA